MIDGICVAASRIFPSVGSITLRIGFLREGHRREKEEEGGKGRGGGGKGT